MIQFSQEGHYYYYFYYYYHHCYYYYYYYYFYTESPCARPDASWFRQGFASRFTLWGALSGLTRTSACASWPVAGW